MIYENTGGYLFGIYYANFISVKKLIIMAEHFQQEYLSS
jgi:hypothetical protein